MLKYNTKYENQCVIITNQLLFPYLYILMTPTWNYVDKACILRNFEGFHRFFRDLTGRSTSNMYRAGHATGHPGTYLPGFPLSSNNCCDPSQIPSCNRKIFMQTSGSVLIRFNYLLRRSSNQFPRL
jgi:hypothetical protein